MAIVQQTDGGLDDIAAMEMVRSGQNSGYCHRLTEGLVVGFQRKEHRMTPRLLTFKWRHLFSRETKSNRLLTANTESGHELFSLYRSESCLC